MRANKINWNKWNKLPEEYARAFKMMLGGGVKISSDDRYTRNFMEFWKTMRRLGIKDEQIWSFPTNSFILQLYVVDCAMIRRPTNSWDTIRYKLRSIDYMAQLCGVKQEWATNPALHALVKYCKNKCKGEGSDTIPITVERVKRIVGFIIRTRLRQVVKDKKRLRNTWELDEFQELDDKHKEWYQLCLGIAMAITTGLRGAEQYKNEEQHMRGYGIKLKDISWIWERNGKRIKSGAYTKNITNLICMIIVLRNSKGKKQDEKVRITIGINKGNICILYLIFRWYHHQKQKAGKDWKEQFLFDLTVQQIKKKWKEIINEMNMFEKNRWRYHGLRKGFATSLQQRGIDKGLISYAGRWSLQMTVYKYITYALESMEPLAKVMWDKRRTSTYGQDLDEYELKMIINWGKEH